jgi:hypothetical protein
MRLNRLRVILEPTTHFEGASTLRVKVELDEVKDSLHYDLVIPDDDFETRFDFAWRQAKYELDNFIEQNRSQNTPPPHPRKMSKDD